MYYYVWQKWLYCNNARFIKGGMVPEQGDWMHDSMFSLLNQTSYTKPYYLQMCKDKPGAYEPTGGCYPFCMYECINSSWFLKFLNLKVLPFHYSKDLHLHCLIKYIPHNILCACTCKLYIFMIYVVFLCMTRSNRITLTNFGLSKHLVRDSEMLTDRRGSLAYVSPDVLSGKFLRLFGYSFY